MAIVPYACLCGSSTARSFLFEFPKIEDIRTSMRKFTLRFNVYSARSSCVILQGGGGRGLTRALHSVTKDVRGGKKGPVSVTHFPDCPYVLVVAFPYDYQMSAKEPVAART